MKVLSKILLPIALLVFIANIVYVWQSPAMKNSIMGNDEYFFFCTTMNLPDYSTTGEWLCRDEAPNPTGVDNAAEFWFSMAYTKPVWVHPLVVNYLAYPIAMNFDDVVNQIQWLRLFDILMIIITVFLFVDIIRRRTNKYIAAISILPLLFGNYLLANGIMFYNDLFMWLFFALTMWVIDRYPNSKWIYPLALITILSKMNAIFLLIPIWLGLYYHKSVIKNKIAIASVASVFIFVIVQAVLAKDALYLWHHWGTLTYNPHLNIRQNVFPHLWDYALSWGLWYSIPLLLVGIFLIIKRRLKSFYSFGVFGAVTLLYGFGWGAFAYHVFPVMYSSMFMIPIVIGVKDVEVAMPA